MDRFSLGSEGCEMEMVVYQLVWVLVLGPVLKLQGAGLQHDHLFSFCLLVFAAFHEVRCCFLVHPHLEMEENLLGEKS